ncbi:hypothetical protein AB0A63_31385 [Lentzea sp. NPDC042327]|uniref:hypothetical protein n=1 Tax=Lentzea sp. NPDC042327 TaxID=3154801 RepID=UPI0033FC2225
MALLQTLWGTVLMGIGIALLLHARLGLLPLDVFHAALADRMGWSVGVAFTVTQAVFLLLYVPLRIRWGIGTLAAAVVPAIVCDGMTRAVPPAEHILLRAGFLLLGTVAFVVGVAAYLAADLGALPRDGVMIEMARRRRRSLASVRVLFDLAALLAGVLLLGPASAIDRGVVGIASIVLAMLLGPLILRALPQFALVSGSRRLVR